MPESESGEEVRAALERILSWPAMARSPQLGKFLSYIVERTLAGEAQTIKAYSIAIDVFGRPADFDPQVDPIVRVQARRLRGLLKAYYAGPGASERICIALPRGRYVPDFRIQTPTAEPAPAPAERKPEAVRPAEPSPRPTLRPSSRKGQRAALAVLAILGLLALIVMLPFNPFGSSARPGPQAPALLVAEFQALTGEPADMHLVPGLSIELVTDLELFEDMDVAYAEIEQAEQNARFDFVLNGVARLAPERVQYSAFLTKLDANDVIWTQVIERPLASADEADVLDEISRWLSFVLGDVRGPVHAETHDAVLAGTDFAGEETVYACWMLFQVYRDLEDAALGGRAAACLAALAAPEDDIPIVLAMRAHLVWRGIGPPQLAPETREAEARRLIQAAIRRGATSSFVWEQRALHHLHLGEHRLARAAFVSALQLNPANADAAAAFAQLLAFSGEIEPARRLIEEVLTWSPEPIPNWHYGAAIVTAYRSADYARALDHAVAYARSDRELGPVFAIMSANALEAEATINRYLSQVLEWPNFRAQGIMPALRQRIDDPVLLADIRTGLSMAGVPSTALDGPY